MSTLRVIQHAPETVLWWYEQWKNGRLDLNPTFQRKAGLWSVQKKAHLIDSILNDFDVPKFYIADFALSQSKLNENHIPYAVIDGKQRFEAIFGFLEGAYPLNKSAVYDADEAIEIKKLKYAQLATAYPPVARKLLDYKPVIMSIATDDDSKIFEMFVRLNSGEAVNGAERRNAQSGPIPELVRELVGHPFLANRIRFGKKRMAEFNLAAKLLLIEASEALVDTKARNLDAFVQRAAEETGATGWSEQTTAQVAASERYNEVVTRVIAVLERMSEAFVPSDALLSSAGHIPVYYWLVRNHNQVEHNLRDFLKEFNQQVLETMRLAKEGGGGVDQDLLNYYTQSRTTNDAQSLRGRYVFLVRRMRQKKLLD